MHGDGTTDEDLLTEGVKNETRHIRTKNDAVTKTNQSKDAGNGCCRLISAFASRFQRMNKDLSVQWRKPVSSVMNREKP